LRAVLRSMRALIFGETWVIPVGVGAALAAAVLLRSALPEHVWTREGGFLFATLVALILAASLARRPD
jgi:hypothetical protein